MADFTSRMVALLGAMRRERNGAVADAMRYYGADYGLNYGVSLPTVRTLARACGRDHEFARYLYAQEVRELRLAALHIAEPERLTSSPSGAAASATRRWPRRPPLRCWEGLTPSTNSSAAGATAERCLRATPP